MKYVLITGANRGIGLELASQLSESGVQVVAACRKASEPLRRMKVKIFEGLDLSRPESFDALFRFLTGIQLDLLINNAGILIPDNLDSLDFTDLDTQILVNAIGPLRLSRTLLPKMEAESKIAFITSRMGSIGDNHSGAYYGYRMSKAALNAGAVSLARDLLSRKIWVGVFHPGMVATEMTGRQGISPQEAAAGLIQQIQNLSRERSGRFFHQNGEELPW